MRAPLRRSTTVALVGAAAVAALLGAASSGQAQGMFPAVPDPFAPKAVERVDAPLAKLSAVTPAMLESPPASDWLMWRRTYDGYGFSPLEQINKANVANLKVAWTWSMANGPQQGTPLVHDGVLFVQSNGDGVEALNASNGDLLWRYTARLPREVAPSQKRMMALAGDKLLLATSNKHIVALNMKTGAVEWDQAVAGEGTFTSGPMVVDDRVIIGATGCNMGRCSITGHELATGKEVWRFYTVAGPGEPGGETWNGIPLDERYGGSSWTSGSYDPSTKLLYWGVGQPYPWNPFARGTSPLKPGNSDEALYTDNTLALDPQTGKLVWHYSHLPNDSWDMDYVFERTLVDVPVDGKMRRLTVTSGKLGIIEGVDAKTGQFVFAKDMGIQNIVQSIDPVTGKKTINPAVIPELNKTVTICPHPGGGRSVGATAYDPRTKILYLPLQEHCTDMTPGPKEPGEKTAPSKFVLKLFPGSDGNLGRLDAVNLATRKNVWTHRERAPQSTGSLPTAGGVVFQGQLDRYFKAYDSATGKELWKTRLNDVPNSAPISFSVSGKQYIAVTTGSGGPMTRTWLSMLPEIRNPPASGATVWVFELPDRR